MSLTSRIDALPEDMKVLCGSFAYGFFAGGEEAGDPVALRVGAELYCYWPRSWYLAVWKPWAHGPGEHDDVNCPWIEDIDGVRGIWEEWISTTCEDEFTSAIEEVSPMRWKGGSCSIRDVELWHAVLRDVKESLAHKAGVPKAH